MVGRKFEVLVQIEGVDLGEGDTLLAVSTAELAIDPDGCRTGGKPQDEIWLVSQLAEDLLSDQAS